MQVGKPEQSARLRRHLEPSSATDAAYILIPASKHRTLFSTCKHSSRFLTGRSVSLPCCQL
ncbi:hypothetical protein DPMN_175067 [Dreissena polymorpha]|uniref:Uncharacterized protein n=1 Tax=Dreissena polymorpha TaxID=45954 RepID=A0A9D4E7H3_DREPO|nr:hypothetical protein DPMN_175067 [Dreissena polymorpha]